ncbi:NAD kinase [Sphaerisporangium rufum]|uniref:NAD kinase n=2 Tax=Sphaerisporangium rufum TaxID=1381558 RepID=A0A919R9E2_9ACTN|nr:NAD kinase [Sphaerisporangium rufum]
MVETVGLVLHPRRDSKEAIDAIVEWSRTRGVTVLGLPDEVGRIDCSAVAVDAATLARRADLLVSLGGDGTMLRTLRMGAERTTPVLGVNLGKLGFLAEIDVAELPPALTAIDDHAFTVEPRMAVRAGLPDGRRVTAFNDIALVRTPGDRLAAVSVTVQDSPFVSYSSDAVIVATSTGSTAYNFSAGGPIVSPLVEGFIVVPSAAHSSFSRALLLSPEESVRLDLLPVSGRLAVEVDGTVAGHLSPGDRLAVTAVRAAGRVVRLGTTTFYERARRKLRVSGSAEVDGESQ